LAPLERDQRNILRGREGLNRADKPVEHGREQRGRRNRMAQMIPEEVAQAVLPLTRPASASRCSVHVKIASCVSTSIKRRVREIVE
jgi:hypothetical protein